MWDWVYGGNRLSMIYMKLGVNYGSSDMENCLSVVNHVLLTTSVIMDYMALYCDNSFLALSLFVHALICDG